MSRPRQFAAPAVFATAIFVSAFLLFQVQPLIGKCILPWFGGTPAVWSTCMLFFQIVLFAGYVYAHVITSYIRPQYQAIVHGLLLLAAAMLLPITPGEAWKPSGHEAPIPQILLLLAACVGLPYFALSATGPLLQRWYAVDTGGASPYRLYALSNVGSLLALVSYPLVVEPSLTTGLQGRLWSAGFLGFGALCLICAMRMFRSHPVAMPSTDSTHDPGVPADTDRPTMGDGLRWFFLAMVPSVMLLATTNQVCMDVAVVPFLWVLPLALYLLSFILCFESDRWYSRKAFSLATVATMAAVVVIMVKGSGGSILAQVGIYFAALFFCCMVCHGELVRLKPSPVHLTAFYLTISAGGAAGGLSVGLLAPMLFTTFFELPIAVAAAAFISWQVFAATHLSSTWNSRLRTRWAAGCVAVALLAITTTGPLLAARDADGLRITAARNFYGILRVEEVDADDPDRHALVLRHGRIIHGTQFQHPSRREAAAAYYGPTTGIGQLLTGLPHEHPQHVGIVGLGIGTLATYAHPGDRYRFYEINPDVITMAEKHFTFLSDSAAAVTNVTGDARLMMERESPQQFDVLVIDAFSGDAIPVHLLTAEAMHVYLRHLNADGVLAFHISNLHFNLRPVITGLAERFGLVQRLRINRADEASGTKASIWVILARDPDRLSTVEASDRTRLADDRSILWTDDRNNLFEILR